MSKGKSLFLALLTLVAAGVMASSAFALPDISMTLSGSFPLHLNFESATTKTKLAGGTAVLTGEGLHTLFLTGALTALGTFRADFLKVTNGTEICTSTGDTSGTVLSEGSFHIVYTNLSPLLLGILYLPNEISLACGEVKIKIKGDLVSSLNGIGTEGTELTTITGSLSGNETGKAAILQYYNDGGTKVVPQLLSSVSGATFKESDEIVEGEPLFQSLEGKMFVITGR